MKYQKVLIKFSGEAFGQKGKAVEPAKVLEIVEEIRRLLKQKIRVAVVTGGGNVSRWKDVKKGGRTMGERKGMQGTLKNVGALEKFLKIRKAPVQVYTSFSVRSKYPHFNQRAAEKDFLKNKVLIFAGGTGHPFFTTDTAAVLRALEIGAQIYIKATKVSGIFNADPFKNAGAKKIKSISYQNYVSRNLKVVDPVAVCLAWENQLPIRVIKWQPGSAVKAALGKAAGSIIK